MQFRLDTLGLVHYRPIIAVDLLTRNEFEDGLRWLLHHFIVAAHRGRVGRVDIDKITNAKEETQFASNKTIRLNLFSGDGHTQKTLTLHYASSDAMQLFNVCYPHRLPNSIF